MAEAVTFAEGAAGFGGVEGAVVVDQGLGLHLPVADHLGGLFVDGHAREEVFGARLGRQRGVLVWRQRGGRSWFTGHGVLDPAALEALAPHWIESIVSHWEGPVGIDSGTIQGFRSPEGWERCFRERLRIGGPEC